jgi:hypothetical protein
MTLRKIGRLALRPTELFERARQRGFALAERHLPGVALSPTADTAWARGQSWRQLFRDRLLPFDGGGSAAVAVAARAACPIAVEELLLEAKHVAAGKVSLLGLGRVPLGEPPQWHREPIALKNAPKRHWSQLPYLDPTIVGDHKVLWELNRHQYFVTLAQASALTGERAWTACLSSLWTSWLNENPPGLGANWASSLECAYRLISWCWSLSLIDADAALSDELRGRLLGSVQAQATHVARYLSTYFSPNTHLTGEALGLLYVALCFPSMPRARQWRELGQRLLDQELERQIRPDGTYFEQASQYQRYTAEIFLHYLLLARSCQLTVPDTLERSVAQQFGVLQQLSTPNGELVLKGDDDGGLLLVLDQREPHQVRGVLHASSVALGRRELAPTADSTSVWYTGWLLGASSIASPEADDVVDSAYHVHMADGGIFCAGRGVKESAEYVQVDAGPHGALSAAHGHADALSLELWLGGHSLFVDRGTFTYVGADRNEFRDVQSHNTVEVIDERVARPVGFFAWDGRLDGQGNGGALPNTGFWFEGHLAPANGARSGYRHRRRVLSPAPDCWIIEDIVEVHEARRAKLRWYLAPAVRGSIRIAGELPWADVTMPGGAAVSCLAFSAGAALTMEPTTVSGRYGRLDASHVIVSDAGAARRHAWLSVVLGPRLRVGPTVRAGNDNRLTLLVQSVHQAEGQAQVTWEGGHEGSSRSVLQWTDAASESSIVWAEQLVADARGEAYSASIRS